MRELSIMKRGNKMKIKADVSSVGNLINMLNAIIKEYPEVKDYPIRVIEDVDYKDRCPDYEPNYWMHFGHDVEISLKGSSGYEQSGEVRFIGRE